MTESSETARVALEYHKALRTEIIERLKMRDHVLLAYLAASGAFVGYSVKEPQSPDLINSLLIILPFLALGAATIVTGHQDQIVFFNQYMTAELAKHLPGGEKHVIAFNESNAAGKHLRHNLSLNFVGQVLLLASPLIFAVFRESALFSYSLVFRRYLLECWPGSTCPHRLSALVFLDLSL